jgi:hypothetical protein
VPVVFLDPGINRTASLPNVNLTTLARYAVDTRSFQSQVIPSSEHHTRRRENLKSHRIIFFPSEHVVNSNQKHYRLSQRSRDDDDALQTGGTIRNASKRDASARGYLETKRKTSK